MNDNLLVDPPILDSDKLAESSAEAVRWIWCDFLAHGYITLFTSRWKAGKTTLLSVLLAKLAEGGQLAGGTVSAGRALVISEETRELWAERRTRVGIGRHVQWLCRPFAGRPTMTQWTRLVDRIADLGVDLVAIDPLVQLLPGDVENSSFGLLSVLEPLHRLTDRGTAVLLLHHPRKDDPAGEHSPRGSSALCGFADVLADLDRPANSLVGDRRRRLGVASRWTQLRHVVIELNADGTDYSLPAEPDTDEFTRGWPILRMVFEDASERLTRKAIRAEWPDDYDCPAPTTLWRWLDRALADGLVERRGAGRRHDPFRYCLPGQVPMMAEIPPLEPLRMDMRQRTADAPSDGTTNDAPIESARSRRKKRWKEKQRLRKLAVDVARGMVAGGHITEKAARQIGGKVDDALAAAQVAS